MAQIIQLIDRHELSPVRLEAALGETVQIEVPQA
jgi:hypothetical protein